MRRTETSQTSGAELSEGHYPESFRLVGRCGRVLAVRGQTVGGRVEPGRAQSSENGENWGNKWKSMSNNGGCVPAFRWGGGGVKWGGGAAIKTDHFRFFYGVEA